MGRQLRAITASDRWTDGGYRGSFFGPDFVLFYGLKLIFKKWIMDMPRFDWHIDPIDRRTPATDSYKSTQRVRRFLMAQCGPKFKFDRAFMAWIKDGNLKTMGDVADEWTRQHT